MIANPVETWTTGLARPVLYFSIVLLGIYFGRAKRPPRIAVILAVAVLFYCAFSYLGRLGVFQLPWSGTIADKRFGGLLITGNGLGAFLAPYLLDPLTAVGIDGEVRYKIRPGLYAAARVGHLAFGTIDGSAGPAGWDADVTRVEAGLGYSIIRNVLVKAVYQYNRRDSTHLPSLSLGAAQLVVRF